ncbi:hypothetical protein HGB07_09715 [Candidatus Roizmanbacteria bacterium]|nr:hypothetical protein [Candidatus Roizmanbacteria bacterium]
MPKRYSGGSGGRDENVNSKGNDRYSSRRSQLDNNDSSSVKEFKARTTNSYKQFRDSGASELVYAHRRVMEKEFDGEILPVYEPHCKSHNKWDQSESHTGNGKKMTFEESLKMCWNLSKAGNILNDLDDMEDRRDHLENTYQHTHRERY